MSHYLANAFSLNMLHELPCTLTVFESVPVIVPDDMTLYVNVIGHQSLIDVLNERFGLSLIANRVNIGLKPGDIVLVVQATMPRLAEGEVLTATQLRNIPLKFVIVRVED
jgi:2-phospho-L-lactate guanylyltransferase (CobY/MobA/RfbA family)